MAIYMADGQCAYHRADVGSIKRDQREHDVEIVTRCSKNLQINGTWRPLR